MSETGLKMMGKGPNGALGVGVTEERELLVKTEGKIVEELVNWINEEIRDTQENYNELQLENENIESFSFFILNTLKDSEGNPIPVYISGQGKPGFAGYPNSHIEGPDTSHEDMFPEVLVPSADYRWFVIDGLTLGWEYLIATTIPRFRLIYKADVAPVSGSLRISTMIKKRGY